MRTLQQIIDDIDRLDIWDRGDKNINLALKEAIENLEFVLDKTLGVNL